MYNVSPADAPRMIAARPSCRGVILLRSEGAAAADVVVVEFTLVIAVRCAVLRRSGVVGSGFGGRCLCVRCVGPQHEKWEPERRITPSSDNRSRLQFPYQLVYFPWPGISPGRRDT